MIAMTTHDNTFLGFTSVKDLIRQMFKYDQVNMPVLLNFATFMTLTLLFVPFLENYIWSPFWTLFVFVGVVMLDFITAVSASWKEKKFVTSKAIKVPFTLMAYIILFSILHSLGKVVEAFEMHHILNPIAFRFLAISVYFLCFAINLLSALKHMAKMGLIPKPVARFIEKFIDIQKNRIDKNVLDNEGEDPKNDDL